MSNCGTIGCAARSPASRAACCGAAASDFGWAPAGASAWVGGASGDGNWKNAMTPIIAAMASTTMPHVTSDRFTVGPCWLPVAIETRYYAIRVKAMRVPPVGRDGAAA